MAMSHGDWSFSDGWITMGLVAWAVVAVVAEMALWPAERRLQDGRVLVVRTVVGRRGGDGEAPRREVRRRASGRRRIRWAASGPGVCGWSSWPSRLSAVLVGGRRQ